MGSDEAIATLSQQVEAAVEEARFGDAISLLNSSGIDAPALNLLRARALYGLERFGPAMNEVTEILDGKLDPALRFRARSVRLRLMGVMSRTEDALTTAIDLARDAEASGALDQAVEAHTEAAWLYARMRCRPLAEARLVKARALAEKAAQDAAAADVAWLARDIDLIEAFVFMLFDERPLAIASYQRALEMAGDSPRARRIRRAAHVGLARIHYLLGEFEAAHREIAALRPFASSDLRSRRALIDILAAEKKWKAVADVYGELRAASPKSSYAESDDLARALAVYRAGDFDGARAAFDAIVAEADDSRDGRTMEARKLAERLARPGAQSLPRKRLYAFPSVAQLRNHCGPASCELYLRFFGVTAAQIEIARAIKFPDGGTPVYRMRNYLEQAGFVARRIEAELPMLRKLIDRNVPVILEEDYSTSRHVAVAIGYDDARGILEVQDPMTHAVRETSYEELAKIQAFSNAGALIAVPTSRPDLIAAIDEAGALDCEYISLVDHAWALFDEDKFELADKFVENSLTLRRDYELAWIYKFQRAMNVVGKEPSGENRVKLHRTVAEAEAIWPDEEWPQTLRGDVAYSENRYGEALTAFEKARDRDPNDPSNWSKIADCHMGMGNYADAKSALISCLTRDPSHTRGTENLAYIYADAGDFANAAVLNDIALSNRPNNPFNHAVHRMIMIGRRNFEASVQDWNKMRELDPPRAERNLVSHVRILCRLGRYDEAEKLTREGAGKSEPHKTDCLIELGYIFYKSGNWTKAIAAADELMLHDHTGSIGPAQRGAAKIGMGDFDGGMADLDEALRRFPALSWALHKRGRALLKKDIERALGSLSASITLSPDVAETRFDLARAFEAVRCSVASTHFRKAAESGELNEAELTYAGEALVSMEGARSAHTFFQSLERQFPKDLAVRRAHAKILLETVWMPAAGLDALREVARLSKDDPFGKLGAAIAQLQRGLEHEEEGEKLAFAAVAAIEADPATAKLMFPRQLVASELSLISRHQPVLEILAKAGGDFVDTRLRVGALIALDRVDEAAATVSAFDVKYTRDGVIPTQSVTLKYKLANARGDFAGALAFAQAAGKQQGEKVDDGRLDDWEVEQFKCLLALGKADEALAFGLAQAGDGGSLGRLAYAAIQRQRPDVARKLAEDTLRLDPTEAYGFYVLGRVAELEGRFDDAMKQYVRTGQAAPGWHISYEEMARVAVAGGDTKLAEEMATLSIKRGGHVCFTAVGLLAETHLVAGRADVARTFAERARRFTPVLKEDCEDIRGVLALIEGRLDVAHALFTTFVSKPHAASAKDRLRVEQAWEARKHLAKQA